MKSTLKRPIYHSRYANLTASQLVVNAALFALLPAIFLAIIPGMILFPAFWAISFLTWTTTGVNVVGGILMTGLKTMVRHPSPPTLLVVLIWIFICAIPLLVVLVPPLVVNILCPLAISYAMAYVVMFVTLLPAVFLARAVFRQIDQRPNCLGVFVALPVVCSLVTGAAVLALCSHFLGRLRLLVLCHLWFSYV